MDSHLKRCRYPSYLLAVKKSSCGSLVSGSLSVLCLPTKGGREERPWERGCSCGTSCVVQPRKVLEQELSRYALEH